MARRLILKRPRPSRAWGRRLPPPSLWAHRHGREQVEHYVRAFEQINGLSSPPITWGA